MSLSRSSSLLKKKKKIEFLYGEEVVGRKLKVFDEGLVVGFFDGKYMVEYRGDSSTRERLRLNEEEEDLIGKRVRVFDEGLITSFVSDIGIHTLEFMDDDGDNDRMRNRIRCLNLDDRDLDWSFSDSAPESFEKKFVGTRIQTYLAFPIYCWCRGTIISFDVALGSHLIEFDAEFSIATKLHNHRFEWVKVLFGREMVGKRIKVYRPLLLIWYEGIVISFDKILGKHWVRYDNGEWDMLRLEIEVFECLKESLEEEEEEDHRVGVRFYKRFEDGWKVGSIQSYSPLSGGTQLVKYLNGEMEVLQISKHRIEWVNTTDFYKEEVVGKRIRVLRSEGTEVFEGLIHSYDEQLAKHWVHCDNGVNRVLELDYEVIECLSPDEEQGEKYIGRKIIFQDSCCQTWYEAIVESFDILSGKHLVKLEFGKKASLVLKKVKFELRKNEEDLVGKKINLMDTTGTWNECMVIAFDSDLHKVQFSNGMTDVVPLHLKKWTLVKDPYGIGEVGKRLRIYQQSPTLCCWYGGVVKEFDTNLKKHVIQYENGSKKTLLLEKEKIQWLPTEQIYETEVVVVGKRLRFYCHDRKGWLDGYVESVNQASNQLLVVFDNGKKRALQPEKELIEWVSSYKQLYDEEVVGKKIRTYLPGPKLWFDGHVKSFDTVCRKHTIKFDVGCTILVDLEKFRIEWPREEVRVYRRPSQGETMALTLTH